MKRIFKELTLLEMQSIGNVHLIKLSRVIPQQIKILPTKLHIISSKVVFLGASSPMDDNGDFITH